jgi:hypothetical protein
MKALRIVPIMVFAPLGQLSAQQIPFSQFYVSVETNDFLHRDGKKTALAVRVQVSKDSEIPQGKTSIDVNCLDFDPEVRVFDAEDRRVFLEATAAANEGREFGRTIVSPAIVPREIKTQFESKQIDGRYMVIVTRGEKRAFFDPVEGERLLHALDEATAGEAWFQSLLNDPTLPTPSQEKHPPRSRGYFLISQIGEVDASGLTYRVSLDGRSVDDSLSYSTGQMIAFSKNGRESGAIGGDWDELLKHVSKALGSLDQNRDYSFVSDDRRYKVEANRESGEVDVTVARSDFFTDRTPLVGHFGTAQLQQIQTLIAEAPAREGWFKEHEALFFTQASE